MRNLLNFLVRNLHWWLFLLLVVASFALLLHDTAYPRSVYLSSANSVTGSVYRLSSSVTSYVGLKTENDDLMEKVAEMEARIQYLQEYISHRVDSVASKAVLSDSLGASGYTFVKAQVVNSSVAQADNYITINKGTADGVTSDMGVISATGAVGVVSLASEHFSIVIPILNSKSRLSCKIRKNNHFGPLVWEGGDPNFAWLMNQPRHVLFNTGDTVVTSGFSTIFPPDIMVGTIVDSKKENNDNFNSLKVALSTDFYTLKNVLVINNKNQKEQMELEANIVRK